MIKVQLALLLVLNAGILYSEEPDQAIPFYSYDNAEYFDDGDPYGLELKPPPIEKDTATKRHVKVGNAKVTVEVKNTDPLSQSNAEWDRMKKNKEKKPEEKKKSRFRDDKEEEKENHNPEASISIKWSSH